MTGIHKLARAASHLTELHGRINDFHTAIADRMIETGLSGDGRPEFRMGHIPAPPSEIALCFGDFLQTARAALDHEVYRLSTGVRPDFEKSAFPIVLEEAAYADEEERFLRFVPGRARGVIRQYQPFTYGAGVHDIFWQLHDLARIDRHRTIMLLAAIVETEHVSWSRSVPSDENPDILFYRPAVAAGDVVLRLPPPDREPSANFEPRFKATVVVGEGDRFAQRSEVTTLADAILKRVQAALRDLAQG